MFGRKKKRAIEELPEVYDLRKRIYEKVSEEKKISTEQLVQEIETELIHKDEIEKKLGFLVSEGFIKRETDAETTYYSPVE